VFINLYANVIKLVL